MSEVFVGTYDQHIVAFGRAPRRAGGEEVIALDAVDLDRRQAEQSSERFYAGDLAREVIRHLGPLGLVFRVKFEAFA